MVFRWEPLETGVIRLGHEDGCPWLNPGSIKRRIKETPQIQTDVPASWLLPHNAVRYLKTISMKASIRWGPQALTSRTMSQNKPLFFIKLACLRYFMQWWKITNTSIDIGCWRPFVPLITCEYDVHIECGTRAQSLTYIEILSSH